MIPVQPQPEPPDFDARVRQPGRTDLASPEGELRPHWRQCATQLWVAYQGICAYSCLYIPRGTGGVSVDHMLPKSKRRELAYEWANYRLACMRMNARKNDLEDVLDPFEVRDGWFALDLSTLEVVPGKDLSEELRQRVQARGAYYDSFRERDLSFRHLQKHFPFLARELVRQGQAQPPG